MYSKKKSLNFGQYVPNDEVLNKKVPENPKYKHVKPAIDTGKNIRKQIDELKEKQKSCQHKKNEVFKRIKCLSFLKLALAVATELLMNENNVQPDSSPETPKTKQQEHQKSIANVLMGIGELDLASEKKRVPSVPVKLAKPMPYLLLDVRDKDAFAVCHITTAKNYPSAMLSRSTGSEIEELMQFKNYPHNLIILYDEDETIAIRVATTLVERGYENVFLLSGGLKLALEICPKNLTTFSQSTLSPLHTFSQNRALHDHAVPKEYFSKEDVEVIESQIKAYRNKVISQPSYITHFSLSSSRTSSMASTQRLSALDSVSCASSVSGRRSTCSSMNSEQKRLSSSSSRTSRLSCTQHSVKNIEQMQKKPIVTEKSKLRKAPWK